MPIAPAAIESRWDRVIDQSRVDGRGFEIQTRSRTHDTLASLATRVIGERDEIPEMEIEIEIEIERFSPR